MCASFSHRTRKSRDNYAVAAVSSLGRGVASYTLGTCNFKCATNVVQQKTTRAKNTSHETISYFNSANFVNRLKLNLCVDSTYLYKLGGIINNQSYQGTSTILFGIKNWSFSFLLRSKNFNFQH